MTADLVRGYSWDLASRLTSRSGADGSATANYDAFGDGTSLTSSSGTQNLVRNYATAAPLDCDSSKRFHRPALLRVSARWDAAVRHRRGDQCEDLLSLRRKRLDQPADQRRRHGDRFLRHHSLRRNGDAKGLDSEPVHLARSLRRDAGRYHGPVFMRARYYNSTTARFLHPIRFSRRIRRPSIRINTRWAILCRSWTRWV